MPAPARPRLARQPVAVPGQANLFGYTPEQERKFAAFDAANPLIWVKFQQIALEAIHRGWDHWSADAVLHVVRFETAVRERGSDFKINNNYSAFYARKFLLSYPQHKDFFRTRKSKADREMRIHVEPNV